MRFQELNQSQTMKSKPLFHSILFALAGVAAQFLAGCASTSQNDGVASRYRADDGRTIEIGKATPSHGGLTFKEPHMEQCWIAEGFNFLGYDTLYIAPTLSTAKFHDDEQRPHELAKEAFPGELSRSLNRKGLFANIALRESDIKPGAKLLKLENTITEYSKGGGAARYCVGLYGGG